MLSKKLRLFLIIVAVISIVTATATAGVISTNNSRVFTVVIDAGHGGIDGGAEGVLTKVKESELNLEIARILREKFISIGFKVVMTRDDNNGLYGTTEPGFKLRDMEKRKEIINGCNADLVISIHLNKYSSPTRRGAQAFYSKNSEGGKKLAESIQSRINVMKSSPRICSALVGDYYILNESKPPSVIVECGFLSSPEDEKLLLTSGYKNEIVLAIVSGSLSYLTSKK